MVKLVGAAQDFHESASRLVETILLLGEHHAALRGPPALVRLPAPVASGATAASQGQVVWVGFFGRIFFVI